MRQFRVLLLFFIYLEGGVLRRRVFLMGEG